MSSPLPSVAIIGAGLAGTALALALHQASIPVRIHESRVTDAPEIASGVVLTPNGLKVLDFIGVLPRIASRCWKSEYRTYKNDKDETTRKTVITNEGLYGYKNHRIWRSWLLTEMRMMLGEMGVEVRYESKFEGIVSENEQEVVFKVNGQEETAGMVIGADGIYSSVRQYLNPGVAPVYTGTTAVLGHIRWDSVKWPYEGYERACTIQGVPGALFFIPEVQDGSEIMVGKQVQWPDQSRTEWEDMGRDKEKLCSFYRKDYENWGSTARQIIDAVCDSKETLYMWPFVRIPKLKRWFSEKGGVIIVGDGAHALPPSSGQGVNQALEDAFTLSLLLKSGNNKLHSLQKWQDMRQERIEEVFNWATNATNVQRMPQADRDRLIKEGKLKDPNSSELFDDMRWLYQPNLLQQVQAWLAGEA